MDSVWDIRKAFGILYEDQVFVGDKLGGAVIEIINASFTADRETIFGTLNPDYIRREHDWYLSMSRNVKTFPEGAPQIWNEVSDKNGYINSNYGWCLWSMTNGYQYINVIKELLANPDSRRAVMIYTRPSMWMDYNENGRSDFICTNTVQYVIRDGFVYAMVQMRSQDAWAGYRNDRAWQNYVLDRVIADLQIQWPGLMKGPIYWNCGSIHLYERQFYLVNHFNKTGEHAITKEEYRKLYPDCPLGEKTFGRTLCE